MGTINKQFAFKIVSIKYACKEKSKNTSREQNEVSIFPVNGRHTIFHGGGNYPRSFSQENQWHTFFEEYFLLQKALGCS